MVEKLSVQIALEGGTEVEKQLADIGKAGQKAFTDIQNAAQGGGGGFQAATKSIAALGTTASEALGAAAAAAQKFGASANELAGVESVIRALGARARDSGTAFNDLAANYDKARASASSFVAVNKEAGISLATLITRVTIVGTVISAVATAITVAAKATLAFGETIQKASAEAVKLGLTLEQFNKQVQGLEKLGLSTQAATEGLQQLGKASEQVKLDAVAKAIKELEEASARGFGAQGTAQLKLLEAAAQGVGEGAKLARAELEKLGLAGARKIEFGMAIPPGMVLTLKDFITVMGDDDKAMQAFQAQLRGMPDGLQRTNLAIAGLGQKAGTELVQSLRLAEGSMTPVEAKAETLRQATEGLSTAWGKFGSLTFSPAVVQGINTATAALGGLDNLLSRMSWSAFGTAAFVALNPLPNLLQLLGGAIVQLGSQISGITWDAISSAGVAAWDAIVTAVQGAGAAITTFVSSLGGIAWDAVASAATTAWNAIVTAVSSAGTAITSFVSSLAGITWDAISSAGVAAWNGLTSAINGAATAVVDFFSKLASGAWDKVKALLGLGGGAPAAAGAPGKAAGGLLGGRGTGTSDSNLAWLSRGEYIMPAAAVRQPGVLSLLEALRRGSKLPGFAGGGLIPGYAAGGDVVEITGRLVDPIDGMVRKLGQVLEQLNTGMIALGNAFASHRDAMTRVWDNVAQVMVDLGILSQRLNLAGKARGGMIGGRGTGTSDSNLAWVSRGEYITPARAVVQPGVLAFLEALRRSGGNLRGVLDGMGRFALGGMIRGPLPAFAAGGLAGGMSNVTIQFPGLPAIGGLRASSTVVDELHRAAALAQVRSGGRKPSRYS